MSTPEVERIKALLDEHGWVTPPKGGCACLCGWTGRLSDHRVHVAEVIARAAGEHEARLRALAVEFQRRGHERPGRAGDAYASASALLFRALLTDLPDPGEAGSE